MSQKPFRIERDSMGELRVPADALWGAHTQRAIENFPISALRLPREFLRALGLIKWAAAGVNATLGALDERTAGAIQDAAEAVAAGRHDEQFPLDVFQTGSGTSSNMNANEVIARLASRATGASVHPNDHVNRAQSSNDVIPAAIHLGAALACSESLLPALRHLEQTLRAKADSLDGIVKTGRTHLMDAMPLRMSQEIGGWASQIAASTARCERALVALHELPLGGTAVGTGVNSHPEFGPRCIELLSARTGLPLVQSADLFAGLSSQDAAVEFSGALRVCAVALMKIANDLRWMNSGPLTGLAEIELPALQPGSSIMPGKVNPVMPEAVAMVAAQVMGNDVTVTVAAQSGNFQLNVMLPLIAHALLQSIGLLARSSRLLADRAIAGFSVNEERLREALERNPILVTALNDRIGYEKGAEIAKRAYAERRSIRDVAAEMTDLSEEESRAAAGSAGPDTAPIVELKTLRLIASVQRGAGLVNQLLFHLLQLNY